MTDLSDRKEFQARLKRSFAEFSQHESVIRDQYARAGAGDTVDTRAAERSLLERATRRFLIDRFLEALDWDLDDARAIVEEARAADDNAKRLYFDYLGVAPATRSPVMLVEAKGFDSPMARRRHSQEPTSQEVKQLLTAALEAIKQRESNLPVISEWAEWLKTLNSYVTSLGELGRATLRRVVITAGRWIIVFEEPIAAFTDPTSVPTDTIHCFTSTSDILYHYSELFDLLHRGRLVDTLPTTLRLSEALELLRPASITAYYRGVVVATAFTGASKRPYPTRTIYPAIVVSSRTRLFGITDYDHPQPLEEPLDGQQFQAFETELARRAGNFERQAKECLGLLHLEATPLDGFPGFPHHRTRGVASRRQILPVIGSTASQTLAEAEQSRHLVIPSDETGSGSGSEYLVVTGQARFYKLVEAIGAECRFHSWKPARDDGVLLTSAPHTKRSATSFTEDGQRRHCEHGHLHSLRRARCHLLVIETHLCCQACIFASDCWKIDAERLPCPSERHDKRQEV